MKPRKVTDADVEYWQGVKQVMKAPPGSVDIGDLEMVLTDDGSVVRSPWIIDERDTEVLDGYTKTVWLSCWGGMVPTDIVVLDTPKENND